MAKAIDKELNTGDIELLVEEHLFSIDVEEIRALMEEIVFTLIDPEENEFHRGDLKVGISHDGDMIEFSGVDPAALLVIERPVKYRVLNHL